MDKPSGVEERGDLSRCASSLPFLRAGGGGGFVVARDGACEVTATGTSCPVFGSATIDICRFQNGESEKGTRTILMFPRR